MAFILSIETATTSCSAALHRDGKEITAIEYHIAQSTASKLSVIIDQLFRLSGIQPAQLNAVCISAGPGSYTGLRIGVATAKGLCYALNIPLIAINTLELMADQMQLHPFAQLPNTLLCPMLDARRMEVYTLLTNSKLEIIEPTEAKIIDELSYQSLLVNQRILFFGNGSDKCREIIRHENAVFVSGVVPSPTVLGELAYKKFKEDKFEDLATYEPYYLKDFMVKKPKSLV